MAGGIVLGGKSYSLVQYAQVNEGFVLAPPEQENGAAPRNENGSRTSHPKWAGPTAARARVSAVQK
eukprot:scaffold36061_cov101-Isochrysis_galbana.AAC.1